MSRRWPALVAAIAVGAAVAVAPVSSASAATMADYVVVSVTGLNFGDDVAFGDPNITMTYTITALQDVTLSTSGWYTPAPDASLSETSGGACPGMSVFSSSRFLAAGSVCTMSVVFNPSVYLAPLTSVQGGRGWTASGAGGVATDQVYLPYTALVHSLDIEPRSLSFTAPPATLSAAQTVTFTNTASVPLSPLTLTSVEPAFLLDLGTCTAALPVGGSCVATIRYQGGALFDNIEGRVRVDYNATGSAGQRVFTDIIGYVRLSGWTYVTPPTTNIAISKVAVDNGPIGAGSRVEWAITVTNLSAVDATNVYFYDFPDDPLIHDSTNAPGCESEPQPTGLQSGVTVRAGWVSCNLGTIPAGTSLQFSSFATVPDDVPPGTVLTNNASAYPAEQDSDYSDNSASASTPPTVAFADLSVAKRALSATVAPGGPVTWLLQVANHGPNDAAAAVVTDTLPAGLTVTDVPAGCSTAGTTVTCTAATVVAGAFVEFEIGTSVDARAAGAEVVNGASISAATYDPDLTNNDASASVSIQLASSGMPPSWGPVLGAVLLGAGVLLVAVRRRPQRRRAD